MGYIQIPKLVGGGEEPVIDVRDMPADWQYFKTLKERDLDQCYLFFAGDSGTFVFEGLQGNSYVTVYGGANGTTPLYRCFWSLTASDRYWAHYVNGSWVRNSTQPASSSFTRCDFSEADLDHYPELFPVTFQKLTGKQITNDAHLGTTQLFTVVVHMPSDYTYSNAYLYDGFYLGSTATNARYTYPLVAYYGPPRGIKSSLNVKTLDLEFVDMILTSDNTGNNNLFAYEMNYSLWLGKIILPAGIDPNPSFESIWSACYGLQEVEFPSNVTQIGISWFDNCYKLKKVTFKGNITSIGNRAFNNTLNLKSITLPNTITSLGESCFSGSGIRNINMPTSLTSIGNNCFYDTPVKEIVLPDTVTSIGTNAFQLCTNLENIRLPSQLTSIPNYAFEACRAIKHITLPPSLQTIGTYAFQYCNNLESIDIPSTVTSIGAYAFSNCFKLGEVTLPNGCTLDNYAFTNCTSLRKVKLPNDLTTIPSYCFYQCRAMEEYELPSTVTLLNGYCFTHNNNLTNLTIPASVTTINASAFSSCGGCKYYKMLGTPPTLANANAFGGSNTYMKILIPYDSIAAYKTATNWSSTTNAVKTRQRGYKYFTSGTTLPITDPTGTYTVKWFANLEDIVNTTSAGSPSSALEVRTANHDGEYYCTIG